MPDNVGGATSTLNVGLNGLAVRPFHGEDFIWQPLDYEQITVATASIGFTTNKLTNLYAAASSAVPVQAGIPNPAANQVYIPAGLQWIHAVCRLETAEIRYLVDPDVEVNIISTTVGTPLEILDTLIVSGQQSLNFFRSIRTGGTSGKLNVTYEYGLIRIDGV